MSSSNNEDSFNSASEATADGVLGYVPSDLAVDQVNEFLSRELNDSEIQINTDLLDTASNVDYSIPLQILAKKFDLLYGAFKIITEHNVTLEKENERLTKNCDYLKEQIDDVWDAQYELEKELYATQQYNRRENIEISGVPSNIEHRDLERFIIHRVLRRIGVNELESYEIVGCHRLGRSTPTRPANVIVRFINRKRAHEALENRYNLKNFPDLEKMFIVENLCPHYKRIFDRCNELKTQGDIKAVWSYNGTVQFKTEDRRDIRGTKVYHLDALNAKFREGRPIDPLRNTKKRNTNNNDTNDTNNNSDNTSQVQPDNHLSNPEQLQQQQGQLPAAPQNNVTPAQEEEQLPNAVHQPDEEEQQPSLPIPGTVDTPHQRDQPLPSTNLNVEPQQQQHFAPSVVDQHQQGQLEHDHDDSLIQRLNNDAPNG